jgi:hypothetical protein
VTRRMRLGEFCQARSGDKADVATVAVFAPTRGSYTLLQAQLTVERVAAHLAPLVAGRVVRYEAPNVLALNFVCQRALGGGGPRTLRSDMLGKTLGPNVLRMFVDVPDDIAEALPILRPPRSAGTV